MNLEEAEDNTRLVEEFCTWAEAREVDWRGGLAIALACLHGVVDVPSWADVPQESRDAVAALLKLTEKREGKP